MTGTTAVAATVCIGPGVQLHSVKSDAPVADGDLMHKGAYLVVEAIAIHAQIGWGKSKAQQTWWEREAQQSGPQTRILGLAEGREIGDSSHGCDFRGLRAEQGS